MSDANGNSHLSAPYAPLGPQDARGIVVVTTLALLFITTLSYGVQLVLVIRRNLFKKTWIVQYSLVLAWVLALIQVSCLLAAAKKGLGADSVAEDSDRMKRVVPLYFTSSFLSIISIGCSKTAGIGSVITLMFPQGRYKLMVGLTLGVTLAYSVVAIAALSATVATCKTGCHIQRWALIASAAVNIISEIVIIALPIPIIIKVRFPDRTRDKSRVAVISGYMVRLLVIALAAGYIASMASANRIWLDIGPTLWSQGLVFTSLIVSCIPTSMSFIKLMASGAMGARLGDTQIGSRGTDVSSGSSNDFSKKIRSMGSTEGTVSICKSEPRLPSDGNARGDVVHVLQELTIESERAFEVDLNTLADPSNYDIVDSRTRIGSRRGCRGHT